jgi:hypothetical protein
MAFVEHASGWWPSFTEVGAKGAEEALVGDGYLGCAQHAPYDGVLGDRRRDRDTPASQSRSCA